MNTKNDKTGSVVAFDWSWNIKSRAEVVKNKREIEEVELIRKCRQVWMNQQIISFVAPRPNTLGPHLYFFHNRRWSLWYNILRWNENLCKKPFPSIRPSQLRLEGGVLWASLFCLCKNRPLFNILWLQQDPIVSVRLGPLHFDCYIEGLLQQGLIALGPTNLDCYTGFPSYPMTLYRGPTVSNYVTITWLVRTEKTLYQGFGSGSGGTEV